MLQVIFVIIGSFLMPQSDTLASKQDTSIVIMKYFDGTDTVWVRYLEEIKVTPGNKAQYTGRRYYRIEKEVKKVYPFAKIAAEELRKYNEKFLNIDDPKARRKYIQRVENEFMKEYEDKFRHFTISEGRYLMLLIDRETQNTSYALIKELKGGFSAVFWQGIARLFGNNLKERYDPYEKHFLIEYIVMGIESGRIK